MLSGLKTGKSIGVFFSSWIRFSCILLGGMSQFLESAGGGNFLLMDFVTEGSVIFTSLGIKINYGEKYILLHYPEYICKN